MSWTIERVTTLTDMWRAGHSARTIANHLGGVTRSAVLGKRYRLHLQRGSPRSRPVVFVPEPVIPVQEFRGVVVNPPGPGRCVDCGRTVQPGRSRCAEHLALRIQLTRPNRRAGEWAGLGLA